MSRVIDVLLKMRDQGFTSTLKNSISLLQAYGRQGDIMRRSVEQTGRAIEGMGRTITTAVTLPIVGMAVTGTKKFGEVDKTLRLVSETMGSTAAESEALSKAMQTAASNSVFTMQESADATLNFARQGFNAAQAADMLTPALNLAAGTATDLSTVTGGLGNAMKAFGAESGDATYYADVLATAQSKANTTVTDLFESMSNAGPVFKSVGWDISDLATATAIFGDNAIAGAEAGTAMKSGLANLSSNSQAIAMLDKLGVNIFDASGNMQDFTVVQEKLHDAFEGLTQEEKLQAASALFGKMQMSRWLALINESPARVRELSGAIDEATVKSQSLSDALMSGMGGSLEKLKSTFDVFQYNVGQIASEVFQPLVDKITGVLDAFNKMDPAQQTQIVKWAAIAAAVGPALIIFGKLVIGASKVLGVMSKISKLGGIIKAAFAVMAAPATVVIAVIAAVGVAIAAVVTHFDTLKQRLSENAATFDRTKEAMGRLHDKLQPIIDKGAELANFLWDVLGDALASGVGDIIVFVTDLFGGLCDMISTVIDWFNKLGEMVGPVMDKVAGAVGKVQGFGAQAIGFLNSPVIGGNASGTSSWRGGFTRVNENGGEIIDLPQGSRIYPHERSINMARQASNSITIPKLADQIVIREDADIERIGDMLVRRLKTAAGNMGMGGVYGSMA